MLQSGKSYTSEYSQTLTLKGEEADKEYVAIKSIPFDQCFAENAQRWNQGLQRILSADSPYMKEKRLQEHCCESIDDVELQLAYSCR